MMEFNEKETFIRFTGEVGDIEACLHLGESEGLLHESNAIVVLCHPHPVHGGTMDNKVVTTLMRTYRDLGIHVLRFNFRGVGKSEGEFDQGVGEVRDVIAAARYVQALFPAKKLLLAGFSFGSAMAAQASHQLDNIAHLTLVAPPVERYSYEQDGKFGMPVVVIQGDKDERVLAQGVYDWQELLQSPATLIRYPEATHFFHGFLTQLKDDLTRVLLNDLPSV